MPEEGPLTPVSVPMPKTAHDLKQEILKDREQSGKRLQKKGKSFLFQYLEQFYPSFLNKMLCDFILQLSLASPGVICGS